MQNQVDVFIGGRDGYHTYRIPALAVAPNGTVLLFAEGRRHGPGDAGDITLLLKRSADGGASWSAAQVVHAEPGDITIGNPCPIGDGDTVHLLFTRNNRRLFHTRSLDNGLTWDPPSELAEAAAGFAYPWVRIGTGPGHGIRMRNGRLVTPLWLCDGEVSKKDRTYRSGVLLSDDHGATWKAGGLVPADYPKHNECVAAELADGRLALNLRGSESGWRTLSFSADGGLTWSPAAIEKQLPCPTCQAGLLALPGGRLVFTNPAGPDPDAPASRSRTNLTVRLSPDGGRTWVRLGSLHAGPAGYSDLAELSDGTLLCAYERGDKAYHEKITVARLYPDQAKA